MKIVKLGVVGYSTPDEVPSNFRETYDSDVAYAIGTMVSYFPIGTRFELASRVPDIVSKMTFQYASHKTKKSTFVSMVGFRFSESEFSEYVDVFRDDSVIPFVKYIDCLVKVGATKKSDKDWMEFIQLSPTSPRYDLSDVYETNQG